MASLYPVNGHFRMILIYINFQYDLAEFFDFAAINISLHYVHINDLAFPLQKNPQNVHK